MCLDTGMSKGVDSKATFISNLRMICKKWESEK